LAKRVALAILVHQATKKKGVARKTKEKWKHESKLQDLAKRIALAILVHQATKKKGVARKTKEKWKNESKP
jgi:hypothetical protein